MKDTFKEIKVRSLSLFPPLIVPFPPHSHLYVFHIDFDKTFLIAGSVTDEGLSKHTFYFREPERFIYIIVEYYVGPVGPSSQATQGRTHGSERCMIGIDG